MVLKAYWSSPGLTVLIDSEMVISTNAETQLAAFCAKHGAAAVAAVWERVSETAILTEMTGTGVIRRTWYQQGRPFNSQLDPRPEVERSPDPHGLRVALAAWGAPVDDVFAERDVTVVELSFGAEREGAAISG